MKPKVWLPVGALFLALLLACGWSLHVLTLREARGGRLLFARAVSPGDAFHLRYTHSVKRKPVWDFYVIDEHHEILQNKTVFPASDFGLPSLAFAGETYTLLEDGNGCISGMQRPIPSLSLRVERDYDNIFTFGEIETLNLSREVGDSVVIVRVERMNLARYALQAIGINGEYVRGITSYSTKNE